MKLRKIFLIILLLLMLFLLEAGYPAQVISKPNDRLGRHQMLNLTDLYHRVLGDGEGPHDCAIYLLPCKTKLKKMEATNDRAIRFNTRRKSRGK